ncbi:MAG: hypothetical protein L6W00_12825 [Lentisphaeria bacterium]|nr:MAG: hypothetical protein L6W00_12825 [Lentisphaeria bacterium]
MVGRDTRATGAMFEEALSAGLLSAGCQVVKLGIVPTPTVQFTVSRIGASGGSRLLRATIRPSGTRSNSSAATACFSIRPRRRNF